jgi:uncharacterized membrane protein
MMGRHGCCKIVYEWNELVGLNELIVVDTENVIVNVKCDEE